MTDRTYKGQLIRECIYPLDGRGRWIVQTYHGPTNNPWADKYCPHYHTIEEARAAIDESIAYASDAEHAEAARDTGTNAQRLILEHETEERLMWQKRAEDAEKRIAELTRDPNYQLGAHHD